MLLAEQNAAFAVRLADRVHVMSQGRIVHSSDAAALWDNEDIKAQYLGVPGVAPALISVARLERFPSQVLVQAFRPADWGRLRHEGSFSACVGRRRGFGVRLVDGRSVGRRPGSARTAAAGRRGVQEHPRAAWASRGRVHGDHGRVLGRARHVVRRLPFGVGHDVGKLRARHQPQKSDGAPDGADDGVHQPDELRRPPGGDVLHVPSRQRPAEGHPEPHGLVRCVDAGRPGRYRSRGENGTDGRSDPGQVHSGHRRRATRWPA